MNKAENASNAVTRDQLRRKPRTRIRQGLLALCLLAAATGLQGLVPAVSWSCTHRTRPIKLGSCGSSGRSYNGGYITGTLGSTVQNSSGAQFILSNNHVLALCGNGVKGDDVWQPAGSGKTVANLTRWATLSATGSNYVDAAIAKVVSGKVNTHDDILGIGQVSQTTGCVLNAGVQMHTGYSGLVAGHVLMCSITAYVTLPCSGALYTFRDQIEVTMDSPLVKGDPGSLLVTQTSGEAMGLFFAAASGGMVAWVNPIGKVLSELNVVGMGGSSSATAVVAAAGSSPAASPTPEAWALHGPSPSDQRRPDWNSRTWHGPSIQQLRGDWITDNYAHALMTIPGVWGVGAGINIPSSPFHAAAAARGVADYEIYIGVHVTAITPEIENKVPTILGGFTVVLEVGEIPQGY
jgi:hypothetical protein